MLLYCIAEAPQDIPFKKGYPENKSDHPHPRYLQKVCPQNMPYNGGPYGIHVGQNQGISTEIMAYGPKNMAYEHPFMPYEPFLWGMGVVFDLLISFLQVGEGGIAL